MKADLKASLYGKLFCQLFYNNSLLSEMILIFSKSKAEITTEQVIDWIQFYDQSWKRINGSDLENFDLYISLDESSDKIRIGDYLLNADDVNVVWFRRWQDNIPYKELVAFDDTISYEVKSHYKLERKKLSQLLFDTFSDIHWLSFPDDDFNKFKALRVAKKVGLSIPATYIVNNIKDLKSVVNSEDKIITKCISESPAYFSKKHSYMMYTREFIYEEVEIEGDRFFPTLFQTKIEKEYELRIFYLDGVCYSMAIFSQRDDRTRDDFRNYNFSKPNRNVPYKLPASIEEKIVLLMQRLEMDTGSIDMVKSIDGEYIFLEVNPVGQFGMTSEPCNYYLEKKVAEYLVDKNVDHGRKSERSVSR